MKSTTTRRSFLKNAAAATVAAPLITSLEEYALKAQESSSPAKAPVPSSKATLPQGKIGKVLLSRILCGGNLISGYAHSRDLIYVSDLLRAYFTPDKIMETWAQCEQHGINTMIFGLDDKQGGETYKRYRAQGGKIQFIAQLAPPKDKIADVIKYAVDIGAVGVALVGNYGDAWTRENSVDKIGEFVTLGKSQGVIVGVNGHELRTVMSVEKAGIKPDFYMKTLHSSNYWSARRPDQMKEVIDNYGIDNYWCMDSGGTVRFMQELERPWIAFKVLAAGAIHPKAGFKYAFENGADFCAVGMFDFQVGENVKLANAALQETGNRDRAWMA
jgi:hypothetical protein